MVIVLKINNVTKAYKDHQVLKGISLQVMDNEIKALIGVNGAGKSTLLDIVCGVKSMDEGQVLINDMSTSDKKKRLDIKYTIGYMPQSFALFNDLTVEENLKYLRAVYKMDIDIDKVIDKCNLSTYRRVIASSLSGGYRQLLSLAGAIVHNPKLLILDEPTSAMDPLFRKDFWKIVKEYKCSGGTVLVITHYLEELLECESFACLSEGIIKYDGRVKEFRKEGFINIEEVLKKFG